MYFYCFSQFYLDHPNIIKLFEVHETRNSIYLIMEYLDGGEFFDYLMEKGKFELTDACKIMRQLLEGLKYLANKNITHRDIKPDLLE